MARKLTALLLVLILSLPACIDAATATNKSVQPLQSKGDTFCTAFSIDEEDGNWATAAHCATYVLKEHVTATINGKPAWVVAVGYPTADVAVFQSEYKAPAFKLADHSVEPCDLKDADNCESISVIGYPYGITRTHTFGHMGARNIPMKHPETGYDMTSDLLDITVAPGNSGSPVFNAKGEVIGVLWGSFSAAPLGIGVPLESVRRAIGDYFTR